MTETYFLKLGGSLITDKNQAHTVRQDILKNTAAQILRAREKNPNLHLLLGHGSGSFGHFPASYHHTRQGVHTSEQWQGFVEVWREARALNTIVMDVLLDAGIPAIAISPSSGISANDGVIVNWDTSQISTAIENSLVPVIYGDVCFDIILGGTIISTEEQFEYLASKLKPSKILLAGIEPGVWKDYPDRTEIIPQITPSTLEEVDKIITRSESPDVTGGMKSKVHSMMKLIVNNTCLEVQIFSGLELENIYRALDGERIGTRLRSD